MSLAPRAKVHLAGIVRDGALSDVLLSAGCPHCKGTLLLDPESIHHCLALSSSEPRSRRFPRALHSPKLFDLMRIDVVCVSRKDSLDHVAALFAHLKSSHLVVTDEDKKPIGVLTPDEVFQRLTLDSGCGGELTATDLLTHRAVCLDGHTPAERAIGLLANREALCIVVVSDAGRLLGLVTSFELIRWLSSASGTRVAPLHG